MKVYNLTSPRSNRPVANQFMLEAPTGKYFQSYESVIAFVPDSGDSVQLDRKYWDYSRTTTKYLCQFLWETKKQIVAKINSGEYILTNLN